MTTIVHTNPTRSPRRWRRLAFHYLEMLLAMGVGMAVGMAVWMRVRRHPWRMTLQMCAAMYVPLVLFPLVAVGGIGSMTFMVGTHVVTCVAMLAVLLAQPEHCS